MIAAADPVTSLVLGGQGAWMGGHGHLHRRPKLSSLQVM